MILLDYGMHQRRLLPLIARTYALHFAQERLAADFHEVFTDPEGRRSGSAEDWSPGPRPPRRSAPGTQPGRSRSAGRRAVARATSPINRFAALKADTDVFTTFEGDNTDPAPARCQGAAHRLEDEFGSLDQIGMVRFVAQQAVDTVVEKTRMLRVIETLRDAVPGAKGNDDPDAGLLDPDYHLSMFRWREDHMTSGAARRIKGGIDRGGDPAEVFSRCQDHVIGLARAHAERLLLEAFLTKVDNMDEGPNKDLMNMVCRPLRPLRDRAGQSLVDGARPALDRPRQGDHLDGQRALQQAASGRRRPGQRVRRTRRDAAGRDHLMLRWAAVTLCVLVLAGCDASTKKEPVDTAEPRGPRPDICDALNADERESLVGVVLGTSERAGAGFPDRCLWTDKDQPRALLRLSSMPANVWGRDLPILLRGLDSNASLTADQQAEVKDAQALVEDTNVDAATACEIFSLMAEVNGEDEGTDLVVGRIADDPAPTYTAQTCTDGRYSQVAFTSDTDVAEALDQGASAVRKVHDRLK